MVRLLSAIILGVSLVIAAALMRPMEPPRYEDFPVDDIATQSVHGVFDNRTGQVCYAVYVRLPRSEERPEGQRPSFMNCVSHPGG